jgi:hypothetical protein
MNQITPTAGKYRSNIMTGHARGGAAPVPAHCGLTIAACQKISDTGVIVGLAVSLRLKQ